MKIQINPGANSQRWGALLACLLSALLITACVAKQADMGPYPVPLPTQALATLLARGISTAKPEYPPPVLAFLSGGTPSAIPIDPALGVSPPMETAPAAKKTPLITPSNLPSTDTLPLQIINAASFYLARRLSLPTNEVALRSWEAAIWPDASLGCPQAGKSYAQQGTPGYKLVLEVNSQQYELHTDADGRMLVLCGKPAISERIPLKRMQGRDEIVELARLDLAERLDAPLDSVLVVSVEAAEWEEPHLGCGMLPGMQPDRAYPGGISGYRILLSAEGDQYEYHSGGLWLVFCDAIK